MKRLSFRIRRRYYDLIVSGDKRVEYRVDSEFWRKRLGDLGEEAIAVFVCGKRVHRRWILSAWLRPRPGWFSDQGLKDVPTEQCWAICLGPEITPEEYEQLLEEDCEADLAKKIIVNTSAVPAINAAKKPEG